ncbi:MAG TPA: nucleotidyltransferase, partial [Gammaproteobacteria bacterium]|nr:nucleotidyltransferase [Gammaproteobacteria bacterium]
MQDNTLHTRSMKSAQSALLAPVLNQHFVDAIARKLQLASLLERVCQALDLTETQYKAATAHYEAVGNWLSEADEILLQNLSIYPHGSFSLGTPVKPLTREEYDVDLVCFNRLATPTMQPAALKKLIGDRLRQKAHYRDILEEKTRCWRLRYANEFHLDITPSILNPACINGGELVPDKQLKDWKKTNPKGYQVWFKEHAKLQSRLDLAKTEVAKARAEIEALPEPTRFKGILKRCIQLYKRHRDIWFSEGQNNELAPISIIITTLAAKSYAYCVRNFIYETELDIVIDTLQHMPKFIKIQNFGDRDYYFIWNEAAQGENFAEKWNTDGRLAKAFFDWQQEAIRSLECLISLSGLDQVGEKLSNAFGSFAAGKAIRDLTDAISVARE